MRINFARKVDRYAGGVLCLIMRMIARAMPGKKKSPGPSAGKPQKVLAIKFFGFGSILQMCPMMTQLKAEHPEARITLLTFSQNRELANLLPVIDDVAVIEFRTGLVKFGIQTLRDIILLRKRRFDVIINCEFFSYFAAIITHLIGGTQTETLGFYNNNPKKDWIFSKHISIDHSRHISELFCKMLLPLGIESGCRSLEGCRLDVDAAVDASVKSLLKDMGIGPQCTLITVNINASELCYNRRWPSDHFRVLIRNMMQAQSDQHRVHILLIGGKEDKDYVNQFADSINDPHVRNLAGILTIPQLAALLRKSDLFIGNDSGPLHLAVACGVPTISFYGPETPNLYGPVGDKHKVFYSESHCSPCLNIYFSKENHCIDNVCLKSIEPDEVFPAVHSMLNLPAAATSDSK